MRKVLWTEGIALTQQHLQCQDYHSEKKCIARNRFINKNIWGISRLIYNHDALADSEFDIIQCKLMLQNGALVIFDSVISAKKLCCQLTGEVITLKLGIAKQCTFSGISGCQDTSRPKWRAVYEEIPDMFNNKEVKEILFGELCIYLSENEGSNPDFDEIPIVKLQKIKDGGYEVVEEYIPPVITIENSIYLMKLVKQLKKISYKKIREAMESNCWDQEKIIRGGRVVDVLGSLYTELSCLGNITGTCPLSLYKILYKAQTKISIICKDDAYKNIPMYAHNNLSATFIPLVKLLQRSMLGISTKNENQLIVRKVQSYLYKIESLKEVTDENLGVYLAIDTQSKIKSQDFHNKIKIGFISNIEELVSRAIKGIPLEEEKSPMYYLKKGYKVWKIKLSKADYAWLSQGDEIAIFVAKDIEKIKLQAYYVA